MSDQQTALAARGSTDLATGLITTPQQLAERVRAWAQEYHVLSPAVQISAIAPSHAINWAVIPCDPRGADVYHDPATHKTQKTKDGAFEPLEVSLSKVMLDKIAQGAGITWTEGSGRRDDGRTPSYWAWEAVGVYRAFDGSPQAVRGNVEIDLRDGSAQIGGWTPELWAGRVKEAAAKAATLPEKDRWKAKPEPINGWTEARLLQARRFGLRLAETEAMNRAIRKLGIKQKYTVAELAKPFVCLRCSFVPDMRDPETKRMVTEHALTGARALYAPRQEPEIIDVTPSQRPDAGPAVPEPLDELAGLPEAPAAPPPEPSREVSHLTFVGKRTQQGQTVYLVRTQETGDRELETVEPAIAKAALAAYKAGTPVVLSFEHVTDGGRDQWVLLELQPVGHDAPAAPSSTTAALTVTDVQRKSGTTNGRPWTRCAITFSDGRTAVTFDTKRADEAEAAKAGGLPVRARLEASEKYPDQLDLVDFSVVDTRQQSLLDAGGKL